MCVKRMSSRGSFFTVCHPYIDVHFLKCFISDLFLGGGNVFIMMV